MEIRYITKDDNYLEISKIYESSWKYAYLEKDTAGYCLTSVLRN